MATTIDSKLPVSGKPKSGFKNLWPDYDYRPQQTQMAQAVTQSLKNEEILLVEAGTGVGKTLAYLLPLLRLSQEKRARVVISTETKSLQQQILTKDLPLAQKLLQKEIYAELCLGASNFVCKRRLQNALDEGQIGSTMEGKELEAFLSWEKKSTTGLRYDYSRPLAANFWHKISRDPSDCLANRCPNYQVSPYFVARRRWQKANVLIVNHSLLASHFALEAQTDAKVLPEFQYLVIDEAHSFPQILQTAFTAQGSLQELRKLIHETASGATELLDNVNELQQQLQGLLPKDDLKYHRLVEELPLNCAYDLINGLEKIEKDLKQKLALLEDEQNLAFVEDKPDLQQSLQKIKTQAHLNSTQKFRTLLEKLLSEKESSEVVWFEPKTVVHSQRANQDFALYFTSLCNGEFTRTNIFGQLSSVILTSATLTTGKEEPFQYFMNELGFVSQSTVDNLQSLKLDSPFDYKKRALLYLPENIADPVYAEHTYHQNIVCELHRLLCMSQGGALALFTSTRSLQFVYKELQNKLATEEEVYYELFSQADLGPQKARKAFEESSCGVLLGLATFWQGVDIPGDKLRMVILTRIPFRVPDEPILAARLELEKQAERDPFRTLQIPLAILSMRQGFGRLLRSSEDRGVVAILDPRVYKRSYGQEIIDILPKAQRHNRFDTLEAAYHKLFAN